MTAKLTETIPYRKTVWLTGFVKTTLSGALISTGVVLIFNGITNHPMFQGFNEIAIVSGFIALIIAIIVITSIDKFMEKKKKEELEEIDKQIDKRAEEIANELIAKHLEERAEHLEVDK
jgi:Na+/melibiose symporter-like transporter